MSSSHEAATPTGDLSGTVLAGRYRLIRPLGQGAWGSVYLGEHITMGRPCAIKFLLRQDDEEAEARFVRGSRNAARIDHPNVCRVFDYGDPPGGHHFLVMEYVEGDSLEDIIEREGALTPTRAAWITKQAADALQAAHSLGIVHRDLKPGNIMIAHGPDGRELVKVVDFDIAKGPPERSDPNLTEVGLVIGTPEYMSPEQYMGRELDPRSDIYSLGIILFHMLTGRSPFEARQTPQEMGYQRMGVPPRKLVDVAAGHAFPVGLQAALDRALEVDWRLRWPSASEFGAAVWAAVHASSPVALQPGGTPAPRPATPAGGRATPSSTPDGERPIPRTEVAVVSAGGRSRRRTVLVGLLATVAALGTAWEWGPSRGFIQLASPVAYAGPNQIVADADASGDEMVTLDGSASSHDGSIVDYAWREGAVLLASGPRPTVQVTLGVGTHAITLTTTDDDQRQATSEVLVDVRANTPPAAEAGQDRTVSDTDGNGTERVVLDGSSSSDADGALDGYAWTEGTVTLGTGASISPTLSVGEHRITLTVTDAGGATDRDELLITVADGAAGSASGGAGGESDEGGPGTDDASEVLSRVSEALLSDAVDDLNGALAQASAIFARPEPPEVRAQAAYLAGRVNMNLNTRASDEGRRAEYHAEALRWVEEAVALDPDNSTYAQILTLLRGGG